MYDGLADRPLLCAGLFLPAGEDAACSKVIRIFAVCVSGCFVCRALGCCALFFFSCHSDIPESKLKGS